MTMNLPTNARMHTAPLDVPRSLRRHTLNGLTSAPAGKMVPIACAPVLREDGIRSGRVRFSFESMETAEMLMNPINVRVRAYFVPFLAFERFDGSMHQLNLAYEGRAFKDQDVVPFFETAAAPAHGANLIHKYLGLHHRPGQSINTAYIEAYNLIWNFLAKNRSPNLALRTRLESGTLAPAFWIHDALRHIVPDFDDARIDGEVALNVVNAQLPVKGIAADSANTFTQTLSAAAWKETGGNAPAGAVWDSTPALAIRGNNTTKVPEIFAEMQANGITVSLSNIEVAKKTAAFAKLREKYNQHDDWIIDLLMDGISIPEQALTQPMLLADKRTIFGQAKRYATDSGNLTESVVNGATQLDMSIQLPRITTGGVVMVVAELMPEQLWERMQDPLLHTTSVDGLPQFLRDYLDPEKVEIVKNEWVDNDHDQPNDTFGYGPQNYKWNVIAPRIGGRFYRPEVDAGFDEDRQRIWAVETQNPTLGEDFYLCTNIHTKPFVVTNQDPFEVITQGQLVLHGNTQFGPALYEASSDYDEVMAEAPTERIDKEA